MKIKIGITGQQGFIGRHLYNSVKLFPAEFELVEFDRSFFDKQSLLNEFVSRCDTIIHLAGLNRHNDPQIIYDTNIGLIEKLIIALKTCNSGAHLIFSSSSQEERDNLYGKSKLHGRELLIDWAKGSAGKFTGLVIPNVFGPFGNPFYNSFIATFCHQLTHGQIPNIDVDGAVKLIYVGDLVKSILDTVRKNESNYYYEIPYTDDVKVSEILKLLSTYKTEYFDLGIIPELSSAFEINLFNTFRSYFDIRSYFPVKFKKNTDDRGTFVEIIKLNLGGQVSFSTTKPGVVRGNHFHTRKIERFAVIKGKAIIQLRKIGSDEVLNFHLDGEEPAYVDMPVWYTHNIKNIGQDELYTNFWINEFYNPDDADTFFEKV